MRHIDPTPETARAFFAAAPEGEIAMLNLLRLRVVADYSASPELAPERPIGGEEAYRRYVAHALPFVERSGGELLFLGRGGAFLIGPQEERWDVAMLVRQRSAAAFLAFAGDPLYLAGLGHRTAAIEDSRLLPLAPLPLPG